MWTNNMYRKKMKRKEDKATEMCAGARVVAVFVAASSVQGNNQIWSLIFFSSFSLSLCRHPCPPQSGQLDN